MKETINCAIRNTFDFELKDAKSGEIKQTFQSHNIVLDNFFKAIMVGSSTITYMWLGQGIGTPIKTGTALFSYRGGYSTTRSNIQWDLDGNGSTEYTIVLNETQMNGNITEVGLSLGSTVNASSLLTHSMITDGENNPITLVKTDLDILTIKATIYAKILSQSNKFKLWGITEASVTGVSMGGGGGTIGNVSQATGDLTEPGLRVAINPLYSACLGNGNIGLNADFLYMGISKLFFASAGSLIDSVQPMLKPIFRKTATVTRDTTNSRMRYSASLLASEGNSVVPGETLHIKSVIIENIGTMEFPNVLFSKKQLELDIGVGNGVATEFSIPLAEVEEDSEEMYIDGVLQSKNSYNFIGKNFNFAQSWDSSDTKYLVIPTARHKHISSGAGSASGRNVIEQFHPYGIGFRSGRSGSTASAYAIILDPIEESPFIWDFITSKTVNIFKNNSTPTDTTFITTSQLWYSDDGDSWVKAAELIANTQSIEIDPPITARYWKIFSDRSNSPNSSVIPVRTSTDQLMRGFEFVRPQLIFNDPPPNDAEISAKVYITTPIKNSNWKMDITIDIYFERGVAS